MGFEIDVSDHLVIWCFLFNDGVTFMSMTIPGGVYLCQVNDHVSCGACCGLYNVADPSYENLLAILETRTRLYEKTPRTYDALEDFAKTVTRMENQERPYPEFHHCPYIGLIGDNLERPGCLLHPLGKGNNNTDFRGLSHWGGFACASYFCPTCHDVPARFKEILKGCTQGWYTYGLYVTERDCLVSFFDWIESQLGKELVPANIMDNTGFISALHEFMALKRTWPYRDAGYNRLGNYFFKDNLYPRETIDYETLGYDTPRSDLILRTMGTSCRDGDQLGQAIGHIARIIDHAVEALKFSFHG